MVGDPAPHVAFEHRVVGEQGTAYRLAHALVQRDAQAERLGERQAAQPRLGLFAVDARQHRREQPRVDGAGDRRDRDHIGVAAVELVADEAGQQRRREHRVGVEAIEVEHLARKQSIRTHRERQRRATGPARQPRDGLRVAEAAALHELARPRGVERREPDDVGLLV